MHLLRGSRRAPLLALGLAVGLAMLPFAPRSLAAEATPPAESCRRNLATVAGALELYAMETAKADPALSIETLVDLKYLKRLPECPAGGTYAIRATDPAKSGYAVSCSTHGDERNSREAAYGERGRSTPPARTCADNLSTLDFKLSDLEEKTPGAVPDKIDDPVAFLLGKGLLEHELKCFGNGTYSAARANDALLGRACMSRCSVHGTRHDAGARVYDEELAKRSPAKGCANFMNALAMAYTKSVIARPRPPSEGTVEVELSTLVEGKFLDALPVCPAGGTYRLRVVFGIPEIDCTVHGTALEAMFGK